VFSYLFAKPQSEKFVKYHRCFCDWDKTEIHVVMKKLFKKAISAIFAKMIMLNIFCQDCHQGVRNSSAILSSWPLFIAKINP